MKLTVKAEFSNVLSLIKTGQSGAQNTVNSFAISDDRQARKNQNKYLKIVHRSRCQEKPYVGKLIYFELVKRKFIPRQNFDATRPPFFNKNCACAIALPRVTRKFYLDWTTK